MKKFLGEWTSPKKKKAVPWFLPLPDITPVTNIPGTTEVPEAQPILKPMLEKKAPTYAGWEKVLHPSQLVLAAGEIPKPATMPKSKGRTRQLTQTIPIIPPLCLLKAPLLLASPPPVRALVLRQLPTLPQGFARVTACLKTPEVVEVGQETHCGLHVHRAGIGHFKCEFKVWSKMT